MEQSTNTYKPSSMINSCNPAKNNNKIGSLEIICGPMFSGKSEELIRRLRRAKIARQKVLTFKNDLDNQRTSATKFLVSHNGTTLNAEPISSIENIVSLALEANADLVGIDEVQFFSKNIVVALKVATIFDKLD